MFKLSTNAVRILMYLSLGVFIIYLSMPTILDVREVSISPERFKGNIRVAGKMQLIDATHSLYWLLDCKNDNGCIGIQSIYEGQDPEVFGVIIAHGQIRQVDKKYLTRRGKYYFKVHKIEAMRGNSLDNLSYSIRGKILDGGHMARVWLYERCKKCSAIKKKLLPATLFP